MRMHCTGLLYTLCCITAVQSAAMAGIVAALRGGLAAETLTQMVAAAELALKLSAEGDVAAGPQLPAAGQVAPLQLEGPSGDGRAPSSTPEAAGPGAAAEAAAAGSGEAEGAPAVAAQGAKPKGRLSLKIKLGQGNAAAAQGSREAPGEPGGHLGQSTVRSCV